MTEGESLPLDICENHSIEAWKFPAFVLILTPVAESIRPVCKESCCFILGQVSVAKFTSQTPRINRVIVTCSARYPNDGFDSIGSKVRSRSSSDGVRNRSGKHLLWDVCTPTFYHRRRHRRTAVAAVTTRLAKWIREQTLKKGFSDFSV